MHHATRRLLELRPAVLELLEQKVPKAAIARRLGICVNSVYHLLNEQRWERRLATTRKSARKYWGNKSEEERMHLNRLYRRRYEARLEARTTGEDILDVYERWGVLLPRDNDYAPKRAAAP